MAKPISPRCPERVEVALRGALGGGAEKGAHKSDRLPTAEEPTFARQVIRVSTINRVGNHEVVRVRPFVRIAGNLSLTVSDLSANIPPFNPQRLLAETGTGNSAAAERRAGRRAGRRSGLRDARHGADHAEAQNRAAHADATK